ncbi:SRPBCC domain-containing protein [Actinokineospora guangxiensis]|uniref:SRPBCC domain-containing protein n=1 Tax=Actinokineospora guangxiensis TaxID=1490288 RepID=A0ABW0EQT1_9PSEU
MWRHLTLASLLARWWAPRDLRVSELVFQGWPGGRIMQEFRDVEDVDGSDVVVGRAEGEVLEGLPHERLVYRVSPVLPDGRLGGGSFDSRSTP